MKSKIELKFTFAILYYTEFYDPFSLVFVKINKTTKTQFILYMSELRCLMPEIINRSYEYIRKIKRIWKNKQNVKSIHIICGWRMGFAVFEELRFFSVFKYRNSSFFTLKNILCDDSSERTDRKQYCGTMESFIYRNKI